MSFAAALRTHHCELWQAMQAHRFVREMRDGSLSEQVFRRYLVQERAFVRTALRVFAFACAKAEEDADAIRLAAIVHELATTQDTFFENASTSSIAVPTRARELGEVALGIAAHGDLLEILSGMLAAEWTYATWCADALADGTATGFRREWIVLHTETAFVSQVDWLKTRVDALGAAAGAHRRRRASVAFGRMLREEIDFHDAPYDAGWSVPLGS